MTVVSVQSDVVQSFTHSIPTVLNRPPTPFVISELE